MSRTSKQVRVAQFAEEENGRIPVVISTSDVVRVMDGDEILVHEAGAVDLRRAPLPIIVTHRDNQINVGIVEDLQISGGKGRGFAVFGEREEAKQYEIDVRNQIIRSVSVGYQRIKGHTRSDGVLVTTRWMPTHVALVAEPADIGAGFYRAEQDTDIFEHEIRSIAEDRDGYHPAGSPGNHMEKTMPEVIAPAANTDPATTRAADIQVGPDPLTAERERMKDLRALGRAHNMADEADRAIDAGLSVDQFRAQVLENLQARGVLRPAESPEIGMSQREIEQFSLCRALLAAGDPVNAHKIAPFELEASRAAQDRRDSSRPKTFGELNREAAITIPVDVLTRGMRVDEGMARAVATQLIQRAMQRGGDAMHAYRDLVVGTPTAGGNLVATELLGSSFIDLLRNAMVLDQLGVTWLRDLNGNVAIPSQTGAATTYWFTEGGNPTESQQTIGQVTGTPKTIGAWTDYSRRLLLQSSIDVEMFVRADLAAIIGQGIQAAAIAGASNGPTGLLATSGIGSVAGGTHGLAPTYDHIVDLESAVANANADAGRLAYLTNTKVRGKLRKTQEFSSTNGKPVWTSAAGRPGIGELLGYDAYTSNSVPSNLTKGSSSGVCSAICFGNWADMLLFMWGGLDLILDPYSLSTSGGKRVVALQDVDSQLRRVASFAAMQDALTT